MSYTFYPVLPPEKWNKGEPHIRVANGNVATCAHMLGYEGGDGGHTIPVDHMPGVIARLSLLSPQTYYAYATPEQAAHYRDTLLEIAIYCRDNNLPLRWS